MLYRYYILEGPINLWNLPQIKNIKKVENFGEKKFIFEIDCEAWGYIDYEYPLAKNEIRDYSLKKGKTVKQD